MKKVIDPVPGSFEAAALFQLTLALRASFAQRLQDLQDMIDFNPRAEAANPLLHTVAQKLRD
jgi:hypothetical protein